MVYFAIIELANLPPIATQRYMLVFKEKTLQCYSNDEYFFLKFLSG